MKNSYYDLLHEPEVDRLSAFLDPFKMSVSSVYEQQTSNIVELQNHITQSYKLIYITQGEITAQINGKNYHLHKGSIAITTPFTLMRTFKQNNEPLHCIHMYFDLQPAHLAAQFIESVRTLCGEYVCYQDDDYAFYPIVEVLKNEFEKRDPGYHYAINQLLHLLMVRLMRKQIKNQKMEPNLIPCQEEETSILHQALQYIESEIHKPLRLKEISYELGVSENYLYKLFVKQLQQSPSRYIAQYKLHRACIMLASKNYSIQEIANHLGFSSIYHFSTKFKKEMGVAPSQYQMNLNG